MRRRIFMTTIGSMALAGLATAAVAQDALPDGARALKDKMAKQTQTFEQRRLDEAAQIEASPGMAQMGLCRGYFSVDPGYVAPGSHLVAGNVFLIIGPLPVSGNYQITPVTVGRDEHPWLDGHYAASRDPYDGDRARLAPVPVKKSGGHSEWASHNYSMQVTDRDDDGCPTYIVFYHGTHEGQMYVPYHPGHAGTSRN